MATYLYHVKHDGANYRVKAVTQSTEKTPSSPSYFADAIYTHPSSLVEVGQIMPAGSTLVSARNKD